MKKQLSVGVGIGLGIIYSKSWGLYIYVGSLQRQLLCKYHCIP